MKEFIEEGKTALGIEFGSTRIKAVLIGPDYKPIASGVHDWENRLENGMWTYSLDAVWAGLRDAYAKLVIDVQNKFGIKLRTLGAIGISGMMHGYLPFDAGSKQLVPFRTWRNTITGQAADKLTNEFHCNVPQRWSIAHLYHAVLNKEPHVKDIAFLTTLSGYVHWKLTGQKVLGIGEASGMFPTDSETGTYNAHMIEQFDGLLQAYELPWTLTDVLPRVLCAGDNAGMLTTEGAKLLDPTGVLQPGIPLCPPEGDAGTGMVATNSVAARTGNVSAGTSVFAMVVLEKALSKVYPEIDLVATPAGDPVAMVHCNTCTSDLDAWVRLFSELLEASGTNMPKPALYDMLYYKALEGDADCGGLVNYNYYSGEPVTGVQEGRPLFMRKPDASFTLANFMRAQLYSTMAALKIGMDILFQQENVRLEQLMGHGGLFKTKDVGQRFMAGAMGVPVSVMETAGEGGPWGIAILAAYMLHKMPGETLTGYLADKVFANSNGKRVEPSSSDVNGFAQFMERYRRGLVVEQVAKIL